ncbi:cilia- and flagella-associated protein 251-like [Portunus trituberculatus]|uniref:cilia- and flagella-associated protein 251-like n=1 Tax=Portunus trituberculatus TaxID=210409 RepID=UPI001E1CBC4C|nr:cilia- and flagella-associated protein 251-like [Portunus trituberculatus]
MLGGPEAVPGPFTFPEDQILRLDRELDQRMTNLLQPRPKMTGQRSPHSMTHRPAHHPAKPHPAGHIFALRNGYIENWDGGGGGGGDGGERREEEEKYNKREENTKEDKENGKQMREMGKDERKEGNDKEKEEEEEEEEDYNIFDEFLDSSTRSCLHQLSGKVEALTHALHLAREECRQMASSKREANRAVQAAERECRAMAKQTQGLKQDSTRLQKTNTDLKLRVKELEQECQALRKEASEMRQREACRGAGHTSLQGQLTRARAENTSLKDQMVTSRALHKEEVEGLRRKLRDGKKRGKIWREIGEK